LGVTRQLAGQAITARFFQLRKATEKELKQTVLSLTQNKIQKFINFSAF
jgi:hypothetical protein